MGVYKVMLIQNISICTIVFASVVITSIFVAWWFGVILLVAGIIVIDKMGLKPKSSTQEEINEAIRKYMESTIRKA